MSLTPQELLGRQEWNKLVKTTVENSIGAKLDGDFVAANYTPGFPYDVKEIYYNAGTLTALDCLLGMTDGIPSLGNPYSSLYKRVINNIKYDFSREDKAKMQKEESEQGSLVGMIVDEYQTCGAEEPPIAYPSIIHIMEAVKKAGGGEDFMHVDVRVHPNLAKICRLLSEYTRIGVYTLELENAWTIADDRMRAIDDHVSNPSDANGGLRVDQTKCNIGWNELPETKQLLDELEQGGSVELSLSADHIDETSSDVYFDKSTSVKIPLGWFVHITVNKEEHYDLSQYARHESHMTVSIKFNGITTLGAIPAPLSENNTTGWLANDILCEAAIKSGEDATGYKLNGSEFDPKTLFGKDGQLKRLKTFVISQQPEITLRFNKFDNKTIKEIFTEHSDISFRALGGLIHGGHDEGYSYSVYEDETQSESLVVTITPPPIGTSGSLAKQKAYVLGGVAEVYETKNRN